MKLPIYLYGHPVLRKISEPIEAADDELRTLVSNMFETMYLALIHLSAPPRPLYIW